MRGRGRPSTAQLHAPARPASLPPLERRCQSRRGLRDADSSHATGRPSRRQGLAEEEAPISSPGEAKGWRRARVYSYTELTGMGWGRRRTPQRKGIQRRARQRQSHVSLCFWGGRLVLFCFFPLQPQIGFGIVVFGWRWGGVKLWGNRSNQLQNNGDQVDGRRSSSAKGGPEAG